MLWSASRNRASYVAHFTISVSVMCSKLGWRCQETPICLSLLAMEAVLIDLFYFLLVVVAQWKMKCAFIAFVIALSWNCMRSWHNENVYATLRDVEMIYGIPYPPQHKKRRATTHVYEMCSSNSVVDYWCCTHTSNFTRCQRYCSSIPCMSLHGDAFTIYILRILYNHLWQ